MSDLVRPLAVAAVLLALLVPAVSAQEANLDAVAASVAGYWSQGDADGLARVLSFTGVSLHLENESHPAAGVRQARAALADLLGRGGTARVVRVEALGGTPERGFAELGWEVSGAAAEGGRHVVFLGFVREDESWRIAEIRVLR